MQELIEKAKLVSKALSMASISHAVVGELSVASHVATKDKMSVHNTRDFDILLNRSDLERAEQALKPLGFSYRKVMGIPAFVPPRKADSTKSRFAKGVHIVWANERARPSDLAPAPSLSPQSVVMGPDGYACLDIKNLLIMKLTSFRLKDQVHIQDLLNIGLITQAIKKSLPPELFARLKQVEEITKQERMGLSK